MSSTKSTSTPVIARGAQSISATVPKCRNCNMYRHNMDDCAMIAGEYKTNSMYNKSRSSTMVDRSFHEIEPEVQSHEVQSHSYVSDHQYEMSDDEYAKWLEEQERMDEYEYEEEDVVEWARKSSMAAFTHFQKTGMQMKNSDFAGRKAGAPLKRDIYDDYE